MNKFFSVLALAIGISFFSSCNESKSCCEYNNEFAFEFLKKVNQETPGEYMVSPLSLQFLLSTILNGAQGSTADEIASVLGYGKGETEAVNNYCKMMLEKLPELDSLTKLTIANALVVNENYPLISRYGKTVEKYYDAEISQLDFSKKEEVLARVNGWCNEKSEGMIPEIMKDVNPDLMAVLMNAVYFKSSWAKPFPKENTNEEDFKPENGEKIKVQMMKKIGLTAYWENDYFQLVRLPYGDGSFTMSVFLPKEGKTVADIVAGLNTDSWKEWTSLCANKDVILGLPRFESKFHIELNKILAEMGMPSVFTADADLSAMFRNPACISLIQQDSAIKVDEEGSEAAAITSGMVKAMAFRPDEEVRFYADHSFLYLISENSTDSILFAGKY